METGIFKHEYILTLTATQTFLELEIKVIYYIEKLKISLVVVLGTLCILKVFFNSNRLNIDFLNVGKESDMREKEKKCKISNENRLFQCAESLKIKVNPREKESQVKGRCINH